MSDPIIAAIIVLYQPRLDQLNRLLKSVISQIAQAFVVDNTPSPSGQAAALIAGFGACIAYTPLMNNMGIAAAQNVGIQLALHIGASHIVFFDQDSVASPGMLQALLSAETTLRNQGMPVAAVGPTFIDEKTGKVSSAVRYSYFGLRTIAIDPGVPAPVEADFLISSGCLIRASALRIVGTMREDLFIDWVDNEWGLRARSMGLRCYVVPEARMGHSIGDGAVSLLWRQIHLHTDARNYYLLRNAIYLMRMKSMGLQWKLCFMPRLPCYLVLYPLLSKHKWVNIRLVLKAILDGVHGHLGPLQLVDGRE